MTLPQQFTQENIQEIFIYHYVEQLISDFRKYLDETLDDEDLTLSEFLVLVRIRYCGETTQKEIVDILNLSKGYAANLLRKFELKGFITRQEDQSNRRRKIVKLTPDGIKKSDELMEIINSGEKELSKKITSEELKTLKNILFKLIV